MNDDTRMSQKPATYFGLIIIAAVLTAIVAHALQVVLVGEASATVSGGAAAAVAVITAIGLKKSTNQE